MSRESDIQEILALPQRYSDGINRKDIETTMSVFAEETRWNIPALAIDVQGRDNLREWYIKEGLFIDHAGLFVSQQIGAQNIVRYTGELANSYTHFHAFRRNIDGTGFQYFMMYDDEIVKNGDRWEFRERIGHFLFRSTVALEGSPIPCPPLRTYD